MTKQQLSLPPTGLDLVKIVLGLTVGCFAASLITGFFFYLTEPIKAKNLKLTESSQIQTLLNLDSSATVDEIRMYLSWKGTQLELLYLTPSKLIHLSDSGTEISANDLSDTIKTSTEQEKDAWVIEQMKTLGRPETFYAGHIFIGKQNSETKGYVVEGSNMGFKAPIRFFVSISQDFNILGLAILSHTEDPGLGAEIVQNYFKNQFVGRSSEAISQMKVIRDPLPTDWKKALESLDPTQVTQWISQNDGLRSQNPQIYAITGATISSAALFHGVQTALKNFQKRMNFLGAYL